MLTKTIEIKKHRGRPRKIRSEEELQKLAEKNKNKLSLAEKQKIKLKAQKEKEAAKKANGENDPKNKDRFYCSNKNLMNELMKWRDSNLEEERIRIKKGLPIDYTARKISNELGQMMLDIGNKLLNHSSFRNYDQELKNDMRSQYLEKAIKGLKNYNFEFNNPFAFFTTAAWNSYLIVIGKHYKHQNLKKELMIKLAQELETYSGMNPASALRKCIQGYIGDTGNEQ